MNEISFYLQADANFQGQLRVREYYDMKMFIAGERGAVREDHLIGLVDDGVRAANRKEYDLFREYVDKNDSRLYEAARAQPGIAYRFDYKSAPAPVAPAAVEDEPASETEPV